jgi:regulatory protein
VTHESVVDTALRALRQRDLSRRELDERLQARGYADEERAHAIGTLERTGLLDDRRFAAARARALAGRGAGDAFIRHALRSTGVEEELVEDALESLEPEAERARLVVERRGAGAKTARYLSGRGFSDDVIAGAVAGGREDELG